MADGTLRSFRAEVKFEQPEGVPGSEVKGTIGIEALDEVRVHSLTARFLMRADGSGETESVEHGAVEILGSPRKVKVGERFEASFSFPLPETGPISFAGEHVRITWLLRIDCKLPWAFDQEQDFAIRVVPRRVAVDPPEAEEEDELADAPATADANQGE